MIPALEDASASELATFVVALITVAASPPSLPVDLESEAPSLRSEMARLRNAPSDAERARLHDLAATFSENVFVWIGVASSEKHEALMAIRAVIPALEPDPARLKAANLDPRMIAFLVVDCARAEAPANFADVAIDTADQATLNVHVLRTIILSSMEHLQRVALREWIKPDRRSVRASAASPMGLRPAPSDKGLTERLHNLDLAADQLTSMLAAELGNAEHSVPVSDSPPPSVDGDLEAMQLMRDPSNEGFAEHQPKVDLVTDKMASMLAVELSNIGPAAPSLDTPDPN